MRSTEIQNAWIVLGVSKAAQERIAELEGQFAQSTKGMLDRAEWNMRQAEEAMQNGNVDELRRLLAQAHADLAEARKRLDALQEQLNQTLAALREEQNRNATLQQQLAALAAENNGLKQQLDGVRKALAAARQQVEELEDKLSKALSELERTRQALTEANTRAQSLQRERDAALQERDKSINQYKDLTAKAIAKQETLGSAGPTSDQSALLEFNASPECDTIEFLTKTFSLFDNLAAYRGFESR